MKAAATAASSTASTPTAGGFASTMRPLARSLPALPSKHPMHVVQSRSYLNNGVETGLTISEEDANKGSANAEYEVLRAIVNREQCLQRLTQAVRTVGKTFKPEVIDVIDLVRIASLDVVERIEQWREAKGDANAAFIWNGVNYLLKMPSDLDFLADFLAIQRWTGFPLHRNPFCVPFPMDPNAATASDPVHLNKSSTITEGITIGKAVESSSYKPSIKTSSEKVDKPSPYATGLPRNGKQAKKNGWVEETKESPASMLSFIFNEDMRRVRNAEAIILRAEEQFGVFSRDPDGRLVPITQALTRKAAVELKKDDRRPITEPSQTTFTYAPHAIQGGVGMAETGWAPPILTPQQLQAAASEKKVSKYVSDHDDTVNPKQRGLAKSGGELHPAETRGSSSRPHKPIRASISSKVDFKRYRQIQSLGDRLAEITRLKEELEAVRRGNGARLRSEEMSQQAIRNSLTNQMGTGLIAPPPQPKPLSLDTTDFPDGFLANLDPTSQPLRKLDFTTVLREAGEEVALHETSSKPGTASTPATPTAAVVPAASTLPKGRPQWDTRTSLSAPLSSAELPPPLSPTSASALSPSAAAMRQTAIEETAVRRKLTKLTEEERITSSLKKHEVDQKAQQRSREIERKRRLLSDQDSRGAAAPVEDEPNVYDFYATKLQSTVRGWLVRKWVAWYREVSEKASIVVQSIIRGWLARVRVGHMRLYFRAATTIQKNFRGWLSRGTSSNMAKKQNLMKNAITIQRVWRGVLGKRRAMNKRDLDRAAKQAFDAVDAASLVASDVKELAHRILYAIEEPSTTSFPPDEVLYLLRQTVLIIQSARGYLGLADYDFFNARHYDEISGEGMDWRQAGKVVNRSETFIRLVRALAYGPGAKPPRLIQLPNAVNALYSAQSNNPRWSLHTFERMGKGSRICCQLFKWLTSMIEISDRQQQFLSLIASSFPDWLPKMNELQQAGRLCEFEIELNKKCIETLTAHKSTREEDEEYLAILEKEIKFVKRASNDAKGRLRHTMTEIAKLKNDQSTRELVALNTLEQRLAESRQELEDLTKALQETSNLADQGDRAAKELVQELRMKLTNQKLKTSEMEGQKKLLELQVESNKAKRRADSRLASNAVMRTILAGEAKAMYIIAQVDAKAMLRAAGVKHASDLPNHLVEMYEPLALREEQLRAESRARFVDAERERKSFEDYLGRSLVENDMKEQKSKSKMSPTEQELEEERLENEKEAVEERRKHMQHLPDAVLHTFPKRPRPVVVALARDLPGPAKKRICDQIIASMPGTFVYLDTEANYGVDVTAIQAVFAANQCAIINVDHGLTRATRDSFLQALDLTLYALVPTPTIALAVGSDKNIRGGAHAPDCGVDKDDLRVLRDSRLKVCMETLALLVCDLQSPSMKRLAMARASEVVPSSQALALVMEANFLFFSDDPVFDLPHSHRRPLTWPQTRKLLLDPSLLAQKMSTTRRGSASLGLVSCLQQYFSHALWPSSHDEERSNDVLLHSLASLLEQFVECEVLCMKGGGAPPVAFTKSSVRGIQAVVVVSDQERPATRGKLRKDGVFWREASALLIKASLEDLRILKTVVKIDQEPHVASIYREKSRIYFEVYHAATSQTFVTSLSSYDVPAMLVPNGTEKLGATESKVPETPMKMYERLLGLLKFERGLPRAIGGGEASPTDKSKTLVCRRDYAFLQQFVCRIDGHLAVVKCYEAALGELYFMAYLPQQCASVKLLVSASDRLALIKDAERGDAEIGEFEIAQTEDARPLLPFVADRLRLCPTVTMFCALYPHREQTKEDMRLNGYRQPHKQQGFRLKVRVHGGAGKLLFRRVAMFLGVRFVLEGRLSSPSKILFLRAYEQRSRRTLRLKLSAFLRRVLLDTDDEDWPKWVPALSRRLKIHWRENHALLLDRTLAYRVVCIANKRYVCSILVCDEHTVELHLRDMISSDCCTCTLDEKQALAFLALVPNTQAVGATTTSTASSGLSHSQLQVVHGLREAHDTEDKALLQRPSVSVLPSNLEGLLRSRNHVLQLIERVCMYLVLLDPKTMRGGFMTARCPVTVKLAWVDRNREESKPLETSLCRREELIVHQLDTYQCRRQRPVVHMEEELDQLAEQKAREANFFGQTVQQASETLSSHLQSLGDSVHDVIEQVTRSTANELLDSMHGKTVERLRERMQPGFQQQDILQERQVAQQTAAEAAAEEARRQGQPDDREIYEGVWRVALEMGLKSNFREGKVRWQGHIAVKVLETNSWVGSEGMGKCYKFIVYEPICAQQFEGRIRSKKHLIEVLGAKARDLLDAKMEKEMLIFIARYRLEVVVNKVDALGEPTGPDAPPYRIEFLCERLYTQDKITPVNADTEQDEEVNNQKLMEIENARGRKIMRLVRRVSGVLMQLTVFELPQAVADAALAGYIPSDPALLGIDTSIPELAKMIVRGEDDSGFAEVRTILANLKRHTPPAFRVVGYDPKSKRKVVLAVQPQAVLEVAGGVFSPYLDPDRRKELAKVLCDALMLFFPPNQPFELTVPWSGAKQAVSTAEVARDKKMTNRSSADRVIQRKGRIFRSVLRISRYDLVVSAFTMEADQNTSGPRLLFNFYSPSVSEAAEIAVDEQMQCDRLGKPIVSFTEGTIRATAIRRFCRFFRAEIIEDILDPTHRVLNVVLLPPEKAYLTEYAMVKAAPPGEDTRPVGLPGVFFPLDTCGNPLHRRGMTLYNRDKDSSPPQKDFLVTVYTKSVLETPERGLVLKLYDRALSHTSILHLGPSELMRICQAADEPDLVGEIVRAQVMQEESKVDDIEQGFKEFTKKGELETTTTRLVNLLIDIVLKDLGFFMSPQDTVVPYIISSPKGTVPS